MEQQVAESNSMDDLKQRIAKAEQAMHHVQKILRKERDRNANESSFLQDISLNLSDDNADEQPEQQQQQQLQQLGSSAVWRISQVASSTALAPRISTPKPSSMHQNGAVYQAAFGVPKDFGVSAIEIDNGQLRTKVSELRSENMVLLKQSQEAKLREDKLKAEMATLKSRMKHLEANQTESSQPVRDRHREFERELEARLREVKTDFERRLEASQRDAERLVQNAESEVSDLRTERDAERRMRIESEKQRDALLRQLDDAQASLVANSRKQNASDSLNNKRERDADEALFEHVRAANEENLRLSEHANRLTFERDALRAELNALQKQAAEKERSLQAEAAEKEASYRRILGEKDAALTDASSQLARARTHNDFLQRTLDDKHRSLLNVRERADRLEALERERERDHERERERERERVVSRPVGSDSQTQTEAVRNVEERRPEEAEDLRRRLSALQTEFETLSVRFELKDAHLADRDAEVRSLNVRLLDLTTEHEKQRADLEAARGEAARLRKNCQEIDKDRGEDRASRDRECSELRTQLERAAEELRLGANENRKLKEAATVGAAELLRVRAEFDELLRRLNSEREQCERMRHELFAVHADKNVSVGEAGELKGQLSEVIGEKDRLERDLAAEKAENRRLTAMVGEENAERQRLLTALSGEQDVNQAERSRFEQVVAANERELASLRDKTHEQARTIGRLEKDLIDRQRLLEQTLARLEQVDGEKQQLEDGFERTNATVLTATDSAGTGAAAATAATGGEQMRDQMNTMASDLSELDKHSKRVEQALQDTRDALRAKTAELSELQSSYRSQLAKLEQEKRNADLALESARKQVETLTSLRDSCLSDFNAALRQKQEVEMRLRDAASSLRRAEDEAKTSRMEVSSLKQRCEAAESQLAIEKQRLDSMSRESDARASRIAELERESARQASELHDRVATLESRIANDFDAQVHAIAAENERLRSEASANARRAAELDAARRELEASLREMHTTKGRSEAASQRLANELEMQQDRVSQLENELEHSRRDTMRLSDELNRAMAASKQTREELHLVAAANVRLTSDMEELQSEHERLLSRLEECAQLLLKKEDELKAVFHQATVLQGEKTDGEKRMAHRVLQLEEELATLRRRTEQELARCNEAYSKLSAAKLAAEQEAAHRVEAALDDRKRVEAELRAVRDAVNDRESVIDKQKRMLIDAEQTIIVKDSTIARLEMRLNAAQPLPADSHNVSFSFSDHSFVARGNANETRSSFTSGNAMTRSIAQVRDTIDDLTKRLSPTRDVTHATLVASKDDSALVTPRTAAYKVIKSASHSTTKTVKLVDPSFAASPSSQETSELLRKVDRDLAKARLPFVSQSAIRHSLTRRADRDLSPTAIDRRVPVPVPVPEPTRVDGEPRRPVRSQVNANSSSLGLSTSPDRSFSLADEFILVPGVANSSGANRSMLTTASADSSGHSHSSPVSYNGVLPRTSSGKPLIVPKLNVGDSEDETAPEIDLYAPRRADRDGHSHGRSLPVPANRMSSALSADSPTEQLQTHRSGASASTADTVVQFAPNVDRFDGFSTRAAAEESSALVSSSLPFTQAEQDIIRLRDRLEALRTKRQT